MFTTEFVEQLADKVADHLVAKLPKQSNDQSQRWPEYMKIRTAALYADRSYDVIWTMVKNMKIPAVRDGSAILIRRVDIDEYMAKNLI
jgi:excisionase family DNA binding protein